MDTKPAVSQNEDAEACPAKVEGEGKGLCGNVRAYAYDEISQLKETRNDPMQRTVGKSSSLLRS